MLTTQARGRGRSSQVGQDANAFHCEEIAYCIDAPPFFIRNCLHHLTFRFQTDDVSSSSQSVLFPVRHSIQEEHGESMHAAEDQAPSHAEHMQNACKEGVHDSQASPCTMRHVHVELKKMEIWFKTFYSLATSPEPSLLPHAQIKAKFSIQQRPACIRRTRSRRTETCLSWIAGLRAAERACCGCLGQVWGAASWERQAGRNQTFSLLNTGLIQTTRIAFESNAFKRPV